MRSLALAALSLVGGLAGGPAHALFLGPILVPADRLMRNVRAHLEDHPEDAQAWYTLGRIHYLVFASGVRLAPVLREDPLPSVAPNWMLEWEPHLRQARRAEAIRRVQARSGEDEVTPRHARFRDDIRAELEAVEREGWRPESLNQHQRLRHAAAAAEALARAHALDPGDGLIRLGQASLLAQYRAYAAPRRIDFVPEALRPGTAEQEREWFLVWDPGRTGQVRSGRDLFGTSTWWILFEHGFQPLAALDDNRDGWLTGGELTGLSAWRDANGNGVADPGEVRTVQELGVVGLSVRPDPTSDGVIQSREGLILSDGRRLPLYDWMPEPIGPPLPAEP